KRALLELAPRRRAPLLRGRARRPRPPPAPARPRELPPPAVGIPSPAVGLGREKGKLPWPAVGPVVAAFGREVHPRFGTEIVRRGIEIEAPEGAPVHAVYPGSVLYRGWLKGYGNLVILDHGQGYYTLYAHAAEVLADEGERVKPGQTIARVGETGSAEGPRVYFEVRYQGRAEDPQLWLRKRP